MQTGVKYPCKQPAMGQPAFAFFEIEQPGLNEGARIAYSISVLPANRWHTM